MIPEYPSPNSLIKEMLIVAGRERLLASLTEWRGGKEHVITNNGDIYLYGTDLLLDGDVYAFVDYLSGRG